MTIQQERVLLYTYVGTLVGSLVAVILASQGVVFVEDHVVVHIVISKRERG